MCDNWPRILPMLSSATTTNLMNARGVNLL